MVMSLSSDVRDGMLSITEPSLFVGGSIVLGIISIFISLSSDVAELLVSEESLFAVERSGASDGLSVAAFAEGRASTASPTK